MNDSTENLFRDLRGKTAIVTGSTKGIGLEIVKMLLSSGSNVVVNSRSDRNDTKSLPAFVFVRRAAESDPTR